MMKKALAFILAGAMTLGGAFTAFATEEAAGTGTAQEGTGAAEEEAGLEELLAALGGEGAEGEEGLGALMGLLGALGGEEGTGTDKGLGDLLGALGGAEGTEGEAGLAGLLGALGGENGEGLGDLIGTFAGEGIGNLLDSLGGEEGISSLVDSLLGGEGSEELIETIKTLGTELLGSIESKGGKIVDVIAQFKNGDGSYDFSKMMDLLENSTESEDKTTVTIGDVEISEEELGNAIGEAVEEVFADDTAAAETAAAGADDAA